jgi:hypothetical protein
MLLSTNKIEFRKKRDFGEILNISFTFLRQHLKPVFKSLLFIAGPFILVGSVLPGLLFYPWIGADSPAGFSSFDISSVLVNILSFIVGVVMAITTLYQYMLLYMKKDTPSHISTADVWKAVRANFFNVLISCACLVIISTIGVMFSGYLIFSVVGDGAGAILGFFLLMFATIYLTVAFSPFLIMRLVEKVDIFRAIGRCFKLIEGKWWQTFALLFVCYIIQSALVSIVFVPFYTFVFAERMLSNDTVPDLTTSLIYVAVGGVILVLTVAASFCLTLVVTCFQYFSLVEDKESVGLMQRIQQLGHTPSSPVAPPARDLYEDQEEY